MFHANQTLVLFFILCHIFVFVTSVSADGSNWIAVSKSVCRLGVFHVLTNIDTHLVARVPVCFIFIYISIYCQIAIFFECGRICFVYALLKMDSNLNNAFSAFYLNRLTTVRKSAHHTQPLMTMSATVIWMMAMRTRKDGRTLTAAAAANTALMLI